MVRRVRSHMEPSTLIPSWEDLRRPALPQTGALFLSPRTPVTKTSSIFPTYSHLNSNCVLELTSKTAHVPDSQGNYIFI